MHSDYVLLLFAPLHPLVYLYLQTNHLFMYGESSLHSVLPKAVIKSTKYYIQHCVQLLNLKFPLNKNRIRFLLWVFESNQTYVLLVS